MRGERSSEAPSERRRSSSPPRPDSPKFSQHPREPWALSQTPWSWQGGVCALAHAPRCQPKKRRRAYDVTEDDVCSVPPALPDLGKELGNVREPAGRWGSNALPITAGSTRSTAWGVEAVRGRERRSPRMPNEIGRHLAQRMFAPDGEREMSPSWCNYSGLGRSRRKVR
jgi:hypothetical protein